MITKARIALKDGGPLSYEFAGRRLQRGESITITSASDIRAAYNTGMCDVTFIQGSIPGIGSAPELEEPEPAPEATEEPEEHVNDPEMDEGLGDDAEEQDAQPEDEDVDTATEEEPEGLPPLTRDDLNVLSKQGIIDIAAKYELNLQLKTSMKKDQMVDMVMEAHTSKVESEEA